MHPDPTRNCYWQLERGSHQEFDAPPPRKTDVVVIGGGLAGLATALAIRDRCPGVGIVVLEAMRVGNGASGRNAGFVSPLAAPGWLLGWAQCPDRMWAARELNAEVHRLGHWLMTELSACEARPVRLRLVAHGRLWVAGLEDFAEVIAGAGINVQCHRDRHKACAVELGGYTLHPYRLVLALARRVAERGVTVCEHQRVRAVKAGTVTLADGHTLDAETVVVCTNAGTSAIELGERIPALAVRSYLAATTPVANSPRADEDQFTVDVNAAQTYHRRYHQRILFGGMDKLLGGGGDGEPPERVSKRLAASLREAFPQVPDLRVAHIWGGQFHLSATGLPVIRRARRNPALVLNVGYGGTGVALTLACARYAASLALERPVSADNDARLFAAIQSSRLSVAAYARSAASIARRLL